MLTEPDAHKTALIILPSNGNVALSTLRTAATVYWGFSILVL
ncbi:MAG: hypothetical protein JWQ87_3946 [Candidatus Sulfotelmatobacter sp.]|nr:hypothetical protein [Candidatus Sulfotelmatobacter sp.]